MTSSSVNTADVVKALGDDAEKWPQATVSQALAAERAHQRSILQWDGERPAALDSALLARAVHHLRTNDGVGTRIGRNAPGVRKAEEPYTRRARAAAESAGEPPAPRSPRRRRVSKKATAKKAAKKAPAPAPAKKAAAESTSGTTEGK